LKRLKAIVSFNAELLGKAIVLVNCKTSNLIIGHCEWKRSSSSTVLFIQRVNYWAILVILLTVGELGPPCNSISLLSVFLVSVCLCSDWRAYFGKSSEAWISCLLKCVLEIYLLMAIASFNAELLGIAIIRANKKPNLISAIGYCETSRSSSSTVLSKHLVNYWTVSI